MSGTRLHETFNLAASFVDAHVEAGRGDRPAIRYEGRTITFGEVAAEVNRSGNALRGLGVEARDRVAILLPDSPEFIASFFGAVKIGAVALPLSTLATPADLRYMLSDSGAKALVVDAALSDRIASIRSDLPDLGHVIVAGGTPSGALPYRDLLDAASHELDPEPTGRDDMCFWQYSSGTTGRPKAAVHRMHDLWEVTERYGKHVLAMTTEDRSFSVAKLYFSYGLGNSLAFPFRYGATVIVHPGRAEPAIVFDLTARERPTLFYAVPTAYASLLAAAEAGATCDLSSVRLCISAGEPLPKALFERWQRRFGIQILDGIGSTEVGYIFISNVPGQVRPGTSGRVIPGYEVKLLDDDDRPVPAGEIGNLWVKGASTFAQYWGQPERTTSTIRGEWMATGDKYSVDADGYLSYAGRSDDMLKVGAMWVSPAEVESALVEHLAVLECAVVGHADADELTKPAAYVVLKAGIGPSDALADELQLFVKDRIAPYKYPRWIHFIADLPKTPTGKIQRYKLRDAREEVSAR